MNNFFLFLLMVITGVVLEFLTTKLHFFIFKTHYKEHHFTWGKYLFFLSFPLIVSFYFINTTGPILGKIFAVSAILGTLLEIAIGYSYHKVVGERLWTYHKYTLSRYTSLLSIPLWGLAGVLFWLMVKAFG